MVYVGEAILGYRQVYIHLAVACGGQVDIPSVAISFDGPT